MSIISDRISGNVHSVLDPDSALDAGRGAGIAVAPDQRAFQSTLKVSNDGYCFSVKGVSGGGPERITIRRDQIIRKMKHREDFCPPDAAESDATESHAGEWQCVRKRRADKPDCTIFALAIEKFIHAADVKHMKVTFMGTENVSIYFQNTSRKFIAIGEGNKFWSGYKLNAYQVRQLRRDHAIGDARPA